MAIGLFMYSAVNVVLWFLFNYNYYFRFLVSAGLVAAIFVLGGGGKKQAAGMMSSIILVAVGSLLFNCLTVFADDNGWSESGRNIPGLLHNNGFPKSLWSSFIPVLFWDLGILLGWPLPELVPPVITDILDIPRQPEPTENPYDFPGRPKSWVLNKDGDIGFMDPITNTWKTYGLVGYDENGDPRYIGQKGDYYDLDEILISYDNAVRNTQYYRDINRRYEEGIKKQREDSQKLSQDGMQYLEDKWRSEAELAKQEKDPEKLFKMLQKCGGELDNKESIKAAMEKAIRNAQKDAEH
ncbi:MAG: hypothetical protein IJT43_01805 [Stomatobaculum sp.]|nr:hypothetical protein [Stomatobaculum sp.]